MIIADTRSSMCAVLDLRLTELPQYASYGGELTVVEGQKDLPFVIARVFTVRSPAGTIRGDHAHRRCAQFLMCSQGAIEVVCDDARERKSFILDRGNVGLLVPPSIWFSEIFRSDISVLVVICNCPYDENDYIRDYAEFLAWRGTNMVPFGGSSKR
jgi:UDP-2-acetamido-3-amino-2,3-dideoxy-glucuronate N-acetyltransferase